MQEIWKQTAETILGDVQLRHVPGFHAVVLTTRGPYRELAHSFSRLKTWAAQVGVDAIANAVGVFYDHPPALQAGDCRYSLCLPTSKPESELARSALAGAARDGSSSGSPAPSPLVEGDVVEVREFPRILAAVTFYRGPVADSAAAYEQVAAWVRERPYLLASAPREVYLAQPGLLGPDFMEVEIHQPVLPRGR